MPSGLCFQIYNLMRLLSSYALVLLFRVTFLVSGLWVAVRFGHVGIDRLIEITEGPRVVRKLREPKQSCKGRRMKSKVTWVVLADARSAKIMENIGPGKGFTEVSGTQLKAPSPSDYADTPGQVHSSHGPGRAAMTRRDPKSIAATAFAQQIAAEMTQCLGRGAYERLVLVAGPHMLGELRAALTDGVRATILAEVDKDLTDVALSDLPKHLADVLAA